MPQKNRLLKKGILCIIGGIFAIFIDIMLLVNSDATIPFFIFFIGFFIGFIMIIVGSLLCMDNSAYNAKEEQMRTAAYQREFEMFIEKHPEIKRLAEERNRKLNMFARNFVAGIDISIRPTPPQYTRGLYKGSLADNISVIANAQKKADYERQLEQYERNQESQAKFRSLAQIYADDYIKTQVELIEALEKIPNSQRFVEQEIEALEKHKAIMRK